MYSAPARGFQNGPVSEPSRQRGSPKMFLPVRYCCQLSSPIHSAESASTVQAARWAPDVVSSQFCSAATNKIRRTMTKASAKPRPQPATPKPDRGMEHNNSQLHQSRASTIQPCRAQAKLRRRAQSVRNRTSTTPMQISASTKACSRPNGTSRAPNRATFRTHSECTSGSADNPATPTGAIIFNITGTNPTFATRGR
jgi:hypothetical protein